MLADRDPHGRFADGAALVAHVERTLAMRRGEADLFDAALPPADASAASRACARRARPAPRRRRSARADHDR
ncbi:MAG: hypothetical protein ACKOAP_01960, partial [Vulcanococcus sp.]